MNTTLTLKTYAAPTANLGTAAPRPLGTASAARALAAKWDMLAVIGLMVSSAVYGVYALTQMTGF